MDGRIHGVVFIAPLRDAGAIGFLAERGFPFVSVSSQPAGPGLHFNADNRRGVVDALEHLVALGHRQIAHITGWPGSPDGKIREDVFRRFCADKGWIVPPEFVEEGNFTVKSGYDAATKLLRLNPRPTAIFAANDEMAYGVCQAARDLGLTIPSDLSVIGFDDSDLCTIHTPQLSTVRQPVDEMATAALRAVVALGNGQTGLASTTFRTQLVIRASTALAPKEVRS
jgi:DNA-binding LacI/PurR family transcriptional regulator